MTTLDRDLNEKALDAAVESFGDFFDDYVSDSTYPALRAAITAYLDALSSIPEQGVGVKLVAMNDQTYRSPREDAAYYGSIWSLSTNQMAELEKTFKYHRDHTELGLITQEPDSSVIESLAPLADREKSADHEASIIRALASNPAAVAVTDEMVELGPDGKEWAKTEAGYAHVESIRPVMEGNLYYGHAVREAFVAGAEWQEHRAALVDRDRVK